MKYYTLRVAIIAAFFFIILNPMAVYGQTLHNKCDRRDHILSELKGGYQETIIARGLGLDKAVMEVLTSSDGTWTLLRTQLFPSGSKWSCIIYAGKAWQVLKSKSGQAL